MEGCDPDGPGTSLPFSSTYIIPVFPSITHNSFGADPVVIALAGFVSLLFLLTLFSMTKMFISNLGPFALRCACAATFLSASRF